MIRTLFLAFIIISAVQAQKRKLPAGVEMISDIVFARTGGRELKLDLFLPQFKTGPFPTVMYLHGGGWRSGSRRQFYKYAAQMATMGYAGVTIDYRLSQEAKYPVRSKIVVQQFAGSGRMHRNTGLI